MKIKLYRLIIIEGKDKKTMGDVCHNVVHWR